MFLQKVIRAIRLARGKNLHDIEGNTIYYDEAANLIIKEKLDSDAPFLFGRLGTTEAEILLHHLYNNGSPFPNELKANLNKLSGFFPIDDQAVRKFCDLYADSLVHADCLFVRARKEEYQFQRSERQIIAAMGIKPSLLDIESLTPFFLTNPWMKKLHGKKILVIHPFEKSIKNQHLKANRLFANNDLSPLYSISAIKAVQSLGVTDQAEGFDSWFHAYTFMMNKIKQIDFDVALIGAGSYGMPLAHECFRKGKQAIYVGGALQLYFGIKGQRWDNDGNFCRLYNQYWVRPLPEESTEKAQEVEGGCYW